MKISNITKKDSKTVAVHLENGNSFFINYEIFVKSQLRKNDELTEENINFLIKENQRFAVKQRAFRYLARRLHSENELRTKLKAKKYDEIIIEEILDDLKANNYLNDSSFAESFADENIINKSWGKNKIKAELIKRGIGSEIIAELLNRRFHSGTGLNKAFEAAEKKYKLLLKRNLEQKRIKEKLFLFLYSKGYDYEESKEAIEKLISFSDENSIQI